MVATAVERSFLPTMSECILSLPFDLKVLQEAASDPDLERSAREIAAGAIMHTLLPQEGEGPLRFVDDALLVRVALAAVLEQGGDGAAAFRTRFGEIYDRLDAELGLFAARLGTPLWPWLTTKIETVRRLSYRGKRAAQYLESDETLALLYEEGLEFETNFNVTAEQLSNRLRRDEQVIEVLTRRHREDARKAGAP